MSRKYMDYMHLGDIRIQRKYIKQMYRIYSDIQELPIKPELFIVEDSNSGYEFFQSSFRMKGTLSVKVQVGSRIFFQKIKNVKKQRKCV